MSICLNEVSIESLTKMDENITKRFPEILYEGTIPTDEDEMDYVSISLKGARIA